MYRALAPSEVWLSGKRAYNLHSVRTSSLKIILRDQAQDSANGVQKLKLNFFLYSTVVFKNIGAGRERQCFSCPPHQNQVGAV